MGLWEEVVEKGKKVEGLPITNTLIEGQIMWLASEFFFAPKNARMQLMWDLKVPKYRLFDELGMMLTGRMEGYGESPEVAKKVKQKVEELAKKFVACVNKSGDREELYECFFNSLEWKDAIVDCFYSPETRDKAFNELVSLLRKSRDLPSATMVVKGDLPESAFYRFCMAQVWSSSRDEEGEKLSIEWDKWRSKHPLSITPDETGVGMERWVEFASIADNVEVVEVPQEKKVEVLSI